MNLEQILRNKLSQKLKDYIQIQKSSLKSFNNFSISHMKVKPRLLQSISQLLNIPLTLVNGTIDKIELNTPWMNIFTMGMKRSSLEIKIDGLKIRSKLESEIKRTYLQRKKDKILQNFTKQLKKQQISELNLLNKIKQYFLGSILIHLSNVELQINVQLKHSITIVLKIGQLKYLTSTSLLKVNEMSLGYKFTNQTIYKSILKPVSLSLESKNEKGRKVKKMSVQKVEIDINNHNLNDIRRILGLISWHNSFIEIPQSLWKYKPPFLKNKRNKEIQNTKQKLLYLFKIIDYKIRDNKSVLKVLILRRKYLQMYDQFEKNPNQKNKSLLLDLENHIQIWRLKQYRKFYHLNQQFLKNTVNLNIPEKEQLNQNWILSTWFKKEEKKLITELQNQLQKVKIEKEQSKFFLIISKIRVCLIIQSHSGKEPFLNVNIEDAYFSKRHNKEIVFGENESSEDEVHKIISVKQFSIEYDSYCGYNKNHRYLVKEKKNEMIIQDEEDEFEDITNFLDCKISNEMTQIQIQPITIQFSNQVLQKFNIFKIQTLHNNYKKTQNILQQQKIFQENNPENSKLSLNSVITIQILQSMHEFPSQSICLNFSHLHYNLHDNFVTTYLKGISIDAYLKCKNHDHSSTFTNIKSDEQQIRHISILKASCKVLMEQTQSMDLLTFQVDNVYLKIQKIDYLISMIKILAPFRPKNRQVRPIYKLKARRKISIGQQFIDACENLNEHIVRSAVLSEVTKNEKQIIKGDKTKKLNFNMVGLVIRLEEDRLQIDNVNLIKLTFPQYSSIRMEEEKKLVIHIGDIKKTLQNLKQIYSSIQFIFKLNKYSNQVESKKNYDLENINDQFRLGNQHIQLIIYSFINAHDVKPIFKLSVNDLQMEINKQGNTYVRSSLNINYYQHLQLMYKLSPVLQTFSIFYQHQRGYNKDNKYLKMGRVKINIQPILIRHIRTFMQSIIVNLHPKFTIINKTIADIKVNDNANTYEELKSMQEVIISNGKSCDIILYGHKFTLNLQSQSELSEREIFSIPSTKFKLLKVKENNEQYKIVSNVKLCNHQSNTFLVNVYKTKKFTSFQRLKKDKGISFEELSSAKVDILKSEDIVLVRESMQEKKTRRLSLSVPLFQRQEKAFRRQQRQQGMELQEFLQELQFRHILLPSESVDLLLDSENYHIELCECDRDGEVVCRFSKFNIRDVLEDDREMLINCEEYEQEQIIVIRTSEDRDLRGMCVFSVNIYSPVVLTNRLPWPLQYRYSKQEIDVIEMLRTGGKQIRKRSFQIMSMEQVKPTKISKSRNTKYQEITQMQVSVGDYYKIFKLNWFINSAKERVEKKQRFTPNIVNKNKQEFSYKGLLCLNNGKSQLQVVIQIKFTPNILKMQIYPHYIILNLTKIHISLTVNEDECSYPHLEVKGIEEEGQPKEFLELSNEKICATQTLELLFKQYSSNVSIFTGSLQGNVKRSVVYEDSQGLQNYNAFGSSGNRNKGTVLYGSQRISLFMRKMPLYNSKSYLLVIMPKLVVINKSDWCFFVKSQNTKELKKLPKHTYDYVLISSKLDIQASEEKEEISYNEWLKISLDTLGTIYYAKEMTSSNGYESKQYELRKKRLKKAPKIFYRIVMTKYDYGYQILIEQSQYPPVSFINKCQSRIKVYEVNQFATQEMEHNEMAEYAPKIPHYEPIFKLYMAENYEFKELGQFNLQEGSKVFNGKIKVAIEEYKDKKIVMVQDSTDVHISQIKNELLLQKLTTFTFMLEGFEISFMNSHYKQLSCLSLHQLEFSHEQKTNKKYVKFRIANIECYSYVGIQPSLLLHRLYNKEMFKIFKKRDEQDFMSLQFALNEHKHATILQKCDINIVPMCVVVDGDIIIYLIKAYYSDSKELMKTMQKLKNRSEDNNKENIMLKSFIIESFVWKGTQIVIKCENLNRLCLFVSKKSINYLIKFITWMGDLRPIGFNPTNIQYQEYTLAKLTQLVDLNKLFTQFTQLLLHYPVSQLFNIVSLIARYYGISETSGEQLNTIKKILKSVYNIVTVLFTSGDQDYMKFKTRYQNRFQEDNDGKENMIQQILNFKYAEWIYQPVFSKTKCGLKVSRFQRYNLQKQIQAYNEISARIKLAIDSHCGNKVFRKIQFYETINYEWVLGVTEEWFALYWVHRDEWIVVKPEQVVNFELKTSKTNIKYTRQLSICIIDEKIKNYEFADIQIDSQKVTEIENYLKTRKLTFYY